MNTPMPLHAIYANDSGAANDEVRTVFIEDLVCDAAIGIFASEHGRTQKIVVNIVLRVANPARPLADDIARVLDYRSIRNAVHDLAGTQHSRLVETLCDAIADFCLTLPGAQAAYVRVGKLEAFDDCRAAGCEVVRRRKGPPVEQGG